jgi:hypothetical protein
MESAMVSLSRSRRLRASGTWSKLNRIGRTVDAETVRFRNPFLVHKVSDIRVYHEQKVKIRLASTRAEFVDRFGRPPSLLDEAIAWEGGRP